MNPERAPQLTEAEFDAALRADHEALLPSSGFAASVMSAIEAEATAPAPIPFPWKRALPGIAIAAAAVIAVTAAFIMLVRTALSAPPAPSQAVSIPVPRLILSLQNAPAGTLWLGVALLISAAGLFLCRRLFSR